MPKKLIVALVFLMLSLIMALPATACEPCMEIATLEETVQAADLIIVGQMVGQGPSTGNGPDWITVQVIEAWKGTPSDTRIRVNSWDGMCQYGIPAEDGQYVMFLANGGDQYNTVLYGCAISRFTVSGDTVIVDDQPVPINDFVASLGSEAQRTPISDPVAVPLSGMVPIWVWLAVGAACLISIVILGGIAFVILRRRMPTT